MGYAFCTGTCGQCGLIFTFNPNSVPSLNNVPFCKTCVDAANNGPRQANSLPPIEYPWNAYEAISESELRY